jgi:hypothetical protein
MEFSWGLMSDWFSFGHAFAASDLYLQKNCFARVVSDTGERVCLNPAEYRIWWEALPEWRSHFEFMRMEWAEFFTHAECDRFGVLRKIFLNVGGTQTDSYRWLFGLGFVHLTNLTGFYWIQFEALQQSVFSFLIRPLRLSGTQVRLLGRVAFLLTFSFFWLMAGLKRGFLRSLLLMVIRWTFLRSHKRVPLGVPVALFMAFDLLVSGHDQWSGTLHYALALIGGKYAFQRGKKGWRLHWEMAIYSWLSCVVFEWSSGRVSPLTPLFSFVTVPLLGVLFFPLTLVTFLWSHLQIPGGESVSELFRSACVLFDFFLSQSALFFSKDLRAFRGLAPSLALVGVFLGLFHWWIWKIFRKSRKSKVTHLESASNRE